MKGGIKSDQGQRKEGRYGCGILPQVISMYLLSAETSGVSRLKGKKVLTNSTPSNDGNTLWLHPSGVLRGGGGVSLCGSTLQGIAGAGGGPIIIISNP